MGRGIWCFTLLFVASTAVPGCAVLAKRPPTPAAKLDARELAQSVPPPNERYYLMMFGSQSTPRQAKYTHTWATVVKVTDNGPGASPGIDAQTISWMPATLEIRPLSLRTEPGVNLDLDTTIREMLKHDEKIVMWGPYEIWHGGYVRFVTQKAFVESGAIGYQCTDTIGEAARTGLGSDCIHAITDLDPLHRRGNYPLLFFGISGSRHALRQIMIRGALIDPDKTHDWLIPALGLDKYPLSHEEYRGRKVPYEPDPLPGHRP